VSLVTEAKEYEPSLGIRLLADLRTVFGDSDAMSSKSILLALQGLEESPWSDLKGKPLNDRGLAHRLRQYGVLPKTVRPEDAPGTARGYTRADLHDVWARYLPALAATSNTSNTSNTSGTNQLNQADNVSDVTDLPLRATQENQQETDNVSDVLPLAAHGGDPDPDDWSFNTEAQDDLDIPEYLRR
jgi:Protein of unknown function (DUF3631)